MKRFKRNKTKYLVNNVKTFCDSKDEEDVIFSQLLPQKSQRGVVLWEEMTRQSGSRPTL